MEGFDFFGLAAKESREPETRELPRRILFRGKLKKRRMGQREPER